jgi:GNAT superfamily N-acetyltransferase
MPGPRVKSQPSTQRTYAAPAPDVVISEVVTTSDREQFVRFPLDHYAGDPHYVPPILAERRDFIDPRVNPLFQQARGAFFIARRHGRLVGRIAAVIDSRYNRFHDTADGFVGLFDCVSDPSVASSLFDAAAQWVKKAGMQRLVGPVNLAFHNDCGLLVEGFDSPPSMMMAYNPRYYARLFELNGFSRLKDLFTYELSAGQGLPQKVHRLAQRARSTGRVKIRTLDTARPEEDLERIKSIYDTMLKPGFGFAPMTEAELNASALRLRPVVLLQPELSLIAEVDGEAVAFIITLPDTNVAQKAAGGFLFPFGLVKMLLAARSIDRLRVLLFGIKDGFRRRGIDALLAVETHERARRLGYVAGELGWIVEDDALMNRTVQATGARRLRTYRIYERPLLED